MELCLVDAAPTFVPAADHFLGFHPEAALRPFARLFLARLMKALARAKIDPALEVTQVTMFSGHAAFMSCTAKLFDKAKGPRLCAQYLAGAPVFFIIGGVFSLSEIIPVRAIKR